MNGIILRATFLNTRSDSLIEMDRNSAEMGRGWLSGTPHLRLLKRMEIIVQLIGGLVKQSTGSGRGLDSLRVELVLFGLSW